MRIRGNVHDKTGHGSRKKPDEAYENLPVGVLLSNVKSWMQAFYRYDGTSYGSMMRGRALFNAEKLKKRLPELTQTQLSDLVKLCEDACRTYATSRGNYYDWVNVCSAAEEASKPASENVSETLDSVEANYYG